MRLAGQSQTHATWRSGGSRGSRSSDRFPLGRERLRHWLRVEWSGSVLKCGIGYPGVHSTTQRPGAEVAHVLSG